MRGIISSLCGASCLFAVASVYATPSNEAPLLIAKLSSLPAAGSIFQNETSGAEEEWNALTQQFVADYTAGNIDAAENGIRRALALAQTTFGAAHPFTADSLNKLGVVYEYHEDFERAKKNYQAALEILEKHYGPAHPEVATALNNLANANVMQGEYATGEALHLRALQIRIAASGEDSYPVAQSTYNLAIVYDHSGQTANAELFYKQAANLWEHVLGANHVNVANSLIKLANIYANQGDARTAEEFYLRALEIQQNNLGPRNVTVADSLFSLGRVCMKQEKYDEAERFYRESAEIMEAELDTDNPRLAVALYSLANVYHIRAKHEAEYNNNFVAKLPPQVESSAEFDLTSQRRAALHTQISLRQRVVQTLYAKAEPLYQRAAAMFKEIYGADYPTLKIIHDELTLLHQGQQSPRSVSRAD